MNSVVTLTALEVRVAEVVGTTRFERSRTNGYRDRSHVPAQDRLKADVDGAGAELAASKASGCRWAMTCGEDLEAPDLEPHVEVRHTTHTDGGLIVRPRDHGDRLFVLVVGTLPRYRVVGWIRGEQARRDEFRWSDVWMVPQSSLTRFCE